MSLAGEARVDHVLHHDAFLVPHYWTQDCRVRDPADPASVATLQITPRN